MSKNKTINNTELNYVVHFCKNPKCNNSWIDIDLTNAKTRPPKWKYCPTCCKEYGFVNPEFPPTRKDYKSRVERLQKYQFAVQKNLNLLNENTEVNTKGGDDIA